MPEPRRIAYVDPAGVEHVLSDPMAGWSDGRQRLSVCRGITGGGAIPRSFVEDVVPGLAGVRRRSTILGARDLALAMFWEAPTPVLLREMLRDWVTWLDTDDPGTLRLYGAAGTRSISAAYAGGLELDETPGNATPNTLRAVVQFRAADPFWWGDARTARYGTASAQPFIPFLPISLARGAVVQQDIAANYGDADAYPVWTVTGPGGPVTLTNQRTGKVLRWSGTLDYGQTVQIDTRPGKGTIRYGDGTSGYRYLDDTTSLWPLPPGSSQLTIDLASAGVGSEVQLDYVPRYRSA